MVYGDSGRTNRNGWNIIPTKDCDRKAQVLTCIVEDPKHVGEKILEKFCEHFGSAVWYGDNLLVLDGFRSTRRNWRYVIRQIKEIAHTYKYSTEQAYVPHYEHDNV